MAGLTDGNIGKGSDAMNPNILIRRAESGDLPELVALLRQLFTIEADFCFREDLQRRGLEMLFARAEAVCLAAESAGKVIGMATAQILISTAAGGKKALVEDVVVTAEFRGRGVGRLLLEGIERWAVSQEVLRLDLAADQNNDPALGFYHRLGWKRTDLIGFQKKLG